MSRKIAMPAYYFLLAMLIIIAGVYLYSDVFTHLFFKSGESDADARPLGSLVIEGSYGLMLILSSLFLMVHRRFGWFGFNIFGWPVVLIFLVAIPYSIIKEEPIDVFSIVGFALVAILLFVINRYKSELIPKSPVSRQADIIVVAGGTVLVILVYLVAMSFYY